MDGPALKPALVLNGEALSDDDDLARELRGADIEIVFRGIDDIAVDIGPAGVRIQETVGWRDLGDFGLVQVLAYRRPTATLLNAIVDYAATRGVRTVNIAGIGAPTKLFKYVRLANRGLSIPWTVYLPPRMLADNYPDLATRLELPFVLKTATGCRGHLTSLVGSAEALAERLRDADHARAGFLAQQLVPPDGSYLLLVLGGQVSLVLQYSCIDADDMLGKSGWEETRLVNPDELDPAARRAAVHAAAALEYDIAGVHLVRHWTTGQWCLLDVSPNPPITSGRHATEKITAYSAYLRRRLSQPGHVDDRQSPAKPGLQATPGLQLGGHWQVTG